MPVRGTIARSILLARCYHKLTQHRYDFIICRWMGFSIHHQDRTKRTDTEYWRCMRRWKWKAYRLKVRKSSRGNYLQVFPGRIRNEAPWKKGCVYEGVCFLFFWKTGNSFLRKSGFPYFQVIIAVTFPHLPAIHFPFGRTVRVLNKPPLRTRSICLCFI
jgi:hypothetical protein